MLTHHSIFAFYENNGKLENRICYGYVETINSMGIAQILLYSDTSSSKKLFSYISSKRDKIIVKPTVTIETINDFLKAEGEVPYV